MSAIAPGLAREVIAPAQKRIPALDGVRALASLMVVAYHFGPHIVRTADSQFAFLQWFPRHGREGVDLFFVLSGFLISGILVEVRQSAGYFKTFYLRRAYRIFPLYYLVLGLYTIAILALGARTARFGALFGDYIPTWTYWLYLQNVAMAAAATYGPLWMAGSWSLAIEEQFYLILPAVVRKISDAALTRIAILSAAFALCLRAFLQYERAGMAEAVLLPARVDSLAAGILVMLLLRNHSEFLRRNLSLVRWLGIAAGAMWLIFPKLPSAISVRMGFVDASISAAVFGLFILNLLLTPEGAISRLLSLRPIRLFGNMAYSTYLFHPILLALMFQLMRGVDPRLNTVSDLPPLAIALVLSFALSWASWTWFEQPVLSRGHRFRY